MMNCSFDLETNTKILFTDVRWLRKPYMFFLLL